LLGRCKQGVADMRLRAITCLVLYFLSLPAVLAGKSVVTVSTNNTPLDRQVLQAVSEEAFGRIGIDFRLTSLPSERSLRSANEGIVDGEGLRVSGLSGAYPNLVQVPEPYVRVSFVAFSRDPSIRLDGWESLKQYRVAFINGWKMFEMNATNARTVTKVDGPEQLFWMLDAGRVDLILYTKADGLALAAQMKLESEVFAISPALKEVDMYLYLNKRHQPLVPQVAAAIRSMKGDGSYNRIISSFGIERNEP